MPSANAANRKQIGYRFRKPIFESHLAKIGHFRHSPRLTHDKIKRDKLKNISINHSVFNSGFEEGELSESICLLRMTTSLV